MAKNTAQEGESKGPTPMGAILETRFGTDAFPRRDMVLTLDEAFAAFTAIHGEAFAIQALNGIAADTIHTYNEWCGIVGQANIDPNVQMASILSEPHF